MNVKAKTAYRGITRKKYLFLLSILVAIVLTFIIDVMTGPASLSTSEVISTILFPAYSERSVQVIVWTYRLPGALMAIVIGITLGLAGANMQTILDNPLASPYTLGISAAAGFGAALAIVLGVGVLPFADTLFVPINAFVFSLISCMAIYGIARFKQATSETIVLTGIAVLFLFDSLLALLQYTANPEQVQAIVFWLFGSLTRANWTTLGITVGIVLVVIPLLAMDVWKLTALRLGDDKARSLGVNVERMRIKGLILVSVLTATAVAFVGTIGFIGLVAPHIARMLVGEDHRYFLPFSALSGAFILSTASIFSKAIVPGIIFPIGILTSLIGIPFFIWLLLSKKRGYW
ncbi:FecCD family ABC transporter permease [Methanosarcina horonobensis]|uniref:FecCD family ABC transporter permease n=1 Tax=Methanosarcina horonobensis TaxID=418008 RepID=UPI00064E8B9E|nr:iron ABC transporter permease [Methanosarcina horonobensis]